MLQLKVAAVIAFQWHYVHLSIEHKFVHTSPVFRRTRNKHGLRTFKQRFVDTPCMFRQKFVHTLCTFKHFLVWKCQRVRVWILFHLLCYNDYYGRHKFLTFTWKPDFALCLWFFPKPCACPPKQTTKRDDGWSCVQQTCNCVRLGSKVSIAGSILTGDWRRPLLHIVQAGLIRPQ